MPFPPRFTALLGVLLCTAMPAAHAEELMITWPADWEVQALPPAADSHNLRQRAVKNDANGDPLMVMELTQTTLAPEHQVNMAEHNNTPKSAVNRSGKGITGGAFSAKNGLYP